MVVEEREMDLWVLRETNRGKRDFGGGGCHGVGGEERERKGEF